MNFADLRARWAALGPRTRLAISVAGPVLLYLILNQLPGTGSFIGKKAPAGIVAQGVVFGTLTGLGALGLVLIYRANRFINFAHAALGSLVGVIAIGVVRGDGFVFTPRFPFAFYGITLFHFRVHHVNYWFALVVGVIVGIGIGALTELVIIRRFKNSSRLVLTVASIGLAQLFGGIELLGAGGINFLALTGGFTSPLHADIYIKPVHFGGDHVLVLIVAPFIVAGLGWFLLRTDAGVAVRAAAENEDRALLLGIPIRRLSTLVWAIAGGLTTLSFILSAPFEGVKPGVASQGPSVLLPLLAAAVVARMESLPLAFGAGIGLGIIESIVRFNSTGAPSVLYVVYFVVIVGALLAQRGKLSRAQEGGSSSWSATAVVKPIPEELRFLPEVRWVKVGVLALVALVMIFVPKGWSISSQGLAGHAMVWAMVGVSLVILTGWAGNISLGQFGIVGIGGVVAANLIDRWNSDLFFVMIGAGAAGALIALVVGLPALRIKGLFLAVTTLSFALLLDQYFLNQVNFPQFIPGSFDRPLLWERFDLKDNYHMYLVCLAFLGLSIITAVGVRKARSGRVLIATRDNQRAADAASVPTTSIKLSGFVLSGVIAGMAGALEVLLNRSVGQGTFAPEYSLTVFSTAVIGGLGSISGALFGVFLFRWLETVKALGQLRQAVTGAGLLVVLLFLPGGLGQLYFNLRDRYLRWVANRRNILVPSLVADKRVESGDDKPSDEVDLLRGALSGLPVGAPGR
jgi:branched-chain amino acid transport system permease protein